MTTDVIRRRSGQKNLKDMINKRRLTWLGHLHRREEDYIPKKTMDWNPGGMRKRGETCIDMATQSGEGFGRKVISWGNMKRLAQDRSRWKSFVARCADMRGTN